MLTSREITSNRLPPLWMRPFRKMVTKAKILSAVASLMCPTFRVADQPDESHEDDVQLLIDLGCGVHEGKTEAGKLESVKFVGQTRISTVLGKAKGMEIAQQNAKAIVFNEIADWCQWGVKSISDDGIEVMGILEENAQNERSQASERPTHDVTSKTAAIIRDLVLEEQHVDPDGETLTLIYAWSPGRAAAAGRNAVNLHSNRH